MEEMDDLSADDRKKRKAMLKREIAARSKHETEFNGGTDGRTGCTGSGARREKHP
jgi:hypothetical protein